MLAGDFNLHHPLWDQYDRESDRARDLLAIAEQGGLTLRTPRGTITRAPQGTQRGRTSTIDHFWASIGLETTYEGLEERQKSDHYPQILHISQASETPIPRPGADQPTGRPWNRLDKVRVANEAELIPGALGGYQRLQAITTTNDLKAAFTALSQRLDHIATVATPVKSTVSRPSQTQAPWWTQEVQEAVRAAKQAERAHRRTPTQHTAQHLAQALHGRTKAIGKAQRTSWRTFIREATTDSRKLWRVERWARLHS